MKNENTEIRIPVGNQFIHGNLTVPEYAKAIVIFSHGRGSSRFSPRNIFVSNVLNQEGIATLLVDLLTPEEDEWYRTRFNIELLTERLIAVTEFIHRENVTSHLPIGYFGGSTGSASALKAAAALPDLIKAVVSRGGRPDLAESDLHLVKAPVMLIVGGLDGPVIGVNEDAYSNIRSKKELVIIDGASHLFEEDGKLEVVAKLASTWFLKYLVKA